jgi:hypothetical protein
MSIVEGQTLSEEATEDKTKARIRGEIRLILAACAPTLSARIAMGKFAGRRPLFKI